MNYKLFVCLALIAHCSFCLADCNVRGVEADAPVLCGNAAQGGFLYGESDWQIDECRGHLSDNAKYADSETCYFHRNDRDGIFIRPIGMEDEGTIKLRFCKSNKCRKFNYKIKQRKYPEQQLKVDDRFIEYPLEIQERIANENDRIAAIREHGDYSFFDFADWKYPFAKKYPASGVYGARRVFNGEAKSPHKGLDIAAPKGTPVHPISGGRVVLAIDAYMSGKTVIILHGHYIFSIYAHLDKINAKAGDVVSTNSIIGRVGSTGRATGAHLHLGLYFNQTPLDPELLFNQKGMR